MPSRIFATMFAADPPVFYWLPGSVDLIRECHCLRAEGVAAWEDGPGVRDLVVEELAFDRLQDEGGNRIKDISHADCRYLTPAEIARVVGVPLPDAATPRRRQR